MSKSEALASISGSGNISPAPHLHDVERVWMPDVVPPFGGKEPRSGLLGEGGSTLVDYGASEEGEAPCISTL